MNDDARVEGDQQSAGAWLEPTAALSRFVPPQTDRSRDPTGRIGTVRYGFRVGGIGLFVRPEALCEVVPQVTTCPLPNTPPWVAGLINLRGNLVPVLDLHLRFGVTVAAEQKRTLLVLDRGESAVGLYADGLPQAVMTQRALAELPPLPAALRDHVQKGYVDEGVVWLEFSHADFFSSLGERLGAGQTARSAALANEG